MEKQSSIYKAGTFNPEDKADVIADFVSSGFTLIPLSGKIPLNKEWQQTEYNMFDSAENYPGNYGVKLSADILVIDYDRRNDKTQGKQAIKNLQKYLDGVVFDTFTVATGGGGLHIYLRKPPEIAVVNQLYKAKKDRNGNIVSEDFAEFSGIEFKSLGRQVVGPCSIHPETKKPYKIAFGKPSHIMDAPQKLLDLIQKKDSVPGIDTKSTALTVFTDDEQSVQRFKSFLNEHPPAIEGDGGDTHTFKTACRGRDYGLSPEKVFELMLLFWNPRCCPPWDESDLWAKVQGAYKYNDDAPGKWSPVADFKNEPVPVVQTNVQVTNFDRAANGMVKRTLHNTCLFFYMPDCPLNGILKYNLFTDNIEFSSPAPWHLDDTHIGWTDEDAVQMKFWLSSVKMYEVSTAHIHEAALKVAMDNRYHPVINYLESLEWDGIPRINSWLIDYAGAPDNKFVRAVSEKVLSAAVARIYQPGIKFDYVLVLEGEQGIGKSTIAHELGGKWFGDIILDPHNRDTVDAIRGKWIVELSEMECTRREISALKRFISCTSDTVRLAYARTAKEFPRKSIFIGTINPEVGRGYLKDSTGNRRFWPVPITGLKFKEFKKDVPQLWAETVYKYKKYGATLWLDDPEIESMARQEVSKRYEADPWEEIIKSYLDHQEEYTTIQKITNECILIPNSRLDKMHKNRIVAILGRLGWRPGVKRVEGNSIRCYLPPEKRTDVSNRDIDDLEL